MRPAASARKTRTKPHYAGSGHRSCFQTEVLHRLAGGYVQRADLVVRAPAAGVPVMLLEIDRRTEDAHELVHKLRRYGEWGRLLPRDADKRAVDLVRSRPDAIEDVGHDKRLWRRVYPPTGREGLVPLTFVFADTTKAKVANTVAVLEEAGRRYWAPRRYETYCRQAIAAKDYSQAVPVVVTTLEQMTEHGADAAVWWRPGRADEQTLTDALDNPDGDALCRRLPLPFRDHASHTKKPLLIEQGLPLPQRTHSRGSLRPFGPAPRSESAERGGWARMWSWTRDMISARRDRSSPVSGSNSRRRASRTCSGTLLRSSVRPASVRATAMARSSSGSGPREINPAFSSCPAW